MSWITKEEMRKRERDVTTFLKTSVNPDAGYGIFRRQSEGMCLGLTAIYGLQPEGYPDLVVTGTADSNAHQHQWVIKNVASFITSTPHVDPKDRYVDIINEYLSSSGMSNTYRAVKIDTDQWLDGFGLNVGRFYGEYPREHMCFIQLVEVSETGFFPEFSSNSQLLLPTTPFGYKETTQ